MAQYDDVAAGYARLIAPRYLPIAGTVADRVLGSAVPSGATVLEVAAGTGLLTSLLVPALPIVRYLATDVAVPMVRIARDAVVDGRVAHVAADALRLPLGDSTADLVVSSLGPVQEDVDAFTEARRVLVPGGRLVLGFWGTGYSELSMLQAARTRLGLGDFAHAPVEAAVERCRAAGFEEVGTTTSHLEVTHAGVEDYLAYRRSFGWPPWLPEERRHEWLPAVAEETRSAYVDATGQVSFSWTIVVLEARRPHSPEAGSRGLRRT